MKEKLYNIIAKSLNIDKSLINEDLGPGDITEWDSLANQNLILALEQEFQLNFDIDEVLDMETVGDIIEILEEKITIK
tara:strand:- start:3788 stop:4021 length:234 start_codon:yes stop_codon:yes gene_type:complete